MALPVESRFNTSRFGTFKTYSEFNTALNAEGKRIKAFEDNVDDAAWHKADRYQEALGILGAVTGLLEQFNKDYENPELMSFQEEIGTLQEKAIDLQTRARDVVTTFAPTPSCMDRVLSTAKNNWKKTAVATFVVNTALNKYAVLPALVMAKDRLFGMYCTMTANYGPTCP